MDSVFELIDSQVVLIIGAIAIALLSLQLLLRILNVAWGTILAIVAVFLVLQYAFGISPRQVWFEISHLPQDLVRLVQGFS
jgi:hypothetical protein